MKCADCEYCDYIYFDGYCCTKFNSYIPEKLLDEDIDCLVKEYNDFITKIYVDEDGCKKVKVLFLETIEF